MAWLVRHLECVACGRRYEPAPELHVCPECGMKGILDVKYDYERLRASLSPDHFARNPEPSQWRYFELLPLRRRVTIQALQVRWARLYRARRLGAHVGVRNVYTKEGSGNPTGSFQDHASGAGGHEALG